PALRGSGVPPTGPRAPLTAGNAAPLPAARLSQEARARVATSWGLPEGEVTYGAGVLEARGHRVTLADLAAERRLAVGASFNVPKITYAGCAVGVIAGLGMDPRLVALPHITLSPPPRLPLHPH